MLVRALPMERVMVRGHCDVRKKQTRMMLARADEYITGLFSRPKMSGWAHCYEVPPCT